MSQPPKNISMKSGGKYGLFVPKKDSGGSGKPKLQNVFGGDSDSDEGQGAQNVRAKYPVKNDVKPKAKSQTQLEVERALAEDPSCCQYDEVYDDMQQDKKESLARRVAEKKGDKPKYVQQLLRTASARKREDERRTERANHKERETEGAEFADKESFVTGAYKAKLAEMAKEEEEEKRKDVLEGMLDVTKQRDLSGFYRHLLNQQTGEEALPSVKPEANYEHDSSNSDTSDDSDEDDGGKTKDQAEKQRSPSPGRRVSGVKRERSPEPATVKRERLDSGSKDFDPSKVKKERSDSEGDSSVKPEPADIVVKTEVKTEIKEELTDEDIAAKKLADLKKLFAKKHVGAKFEAARQRFLDRKAARERGEFVPQVETVV